jgi:uncharacterized protein YciI
MFIVFLRFSNERAQAPALMQAHNAWIASGFADGVFLFVGSLQPDQGGAVIADGISRAELVQRLERDPFVTADVVRAEIHELSPVRSAAQFAAL